MPWVLSDGPRVAIGVIAGEVVLAHQLLGSREVEAMSPFTPSSLWPALGYIRMLRI